MLSGPPRRRRARPVADAPIDALLPRTEDLAKGWLLALLEQAPLGDAPGILAADLSRDGPRLCDAVLRAIADDTDLRRLEPGGALTPLAARVGALAGTSNPESTSRAVEALRAVIWIALRDELSGPDPDLVSELAERLTQVTELLRSAALHSDEERASPETSTTGASRESEGKSPPERRAESELSPERRAAGDLSPERRAVGESPERRAAGESPERRAAGDLSPERRAAGESPPERRWPREAPPEQPDQALWVGALQEEIHRSAGAPLSLLLAELEDAERVAAVEPDDKASATFGEFARAVRGTVRRQDILVSETDSRAWVIARDTGRGGAQALASRIGEAVREAPPWRGAPLTANIGVAVLGEDGRSPDDLIDAAEEARFAAAASGGGGRGEGPDDR